LAHGGLELNLSLQEAQGFVDGLHDLSPIGGDGNSNVGLAATLSAAFRNASKLPEGGVDRREGFRASTAEPRAAASIDQCQQPP